MRIRVYLRTKVFLVIIRKKHMDEDEAARKIGWTKREMAWRLKGVTPLTAEETARIERLMRGHCHKQGGRVTFDDLFQTSVIDSGASL